MTAPPSPTRRWPFPGNLVRVRPWTRRNRHQLCTGSAADVAEAVASILDDLRSGRLEDAFANLDQLVSDLAAANATPAAELATASADLRRGLGILAWLGQSTGPGRPDARPRMVRP